VAGGDAISLMMGYTSILHRVVPNEQLQNQIIDKVQIWQVSHPGVKYYPPEISKLVFQTRENWALDQINNFFRKNPETRDVILIFGKDHNFKNYANKFPPECIFTPDGFFIPSDNPSFPTDNSPYANPTDKASWYGGATTN
jgi:hypothetical protein